MLAGTSIAFADHPELLRSDPPAGAAVAAPARVSLSFGALLNPSGSSVTVTDASGAPVTQGAAQVLPNDNRTMQVALRGGLAAGRYSANWRALSAESGESGTGVVPFTIAGSNPLLARAGGVPMPASAPVLGLTLALVGVALRRTRRGPADGPQQVRHH